MHRHHCPVQLPEAGITGSEVISVMVLNCAIRPSCDRTWGLTFLAIGAGTPQGE